jgi:hypothetical protein
VLLGLYEALMSRNGGEAGYADQALASAVRLKDKAGAPERLYIEAAAAGDDARKAAGPEGTPDDEKEIAIWRRLVKENPQDSQAKIFLAGSLRDG